MLKVYVKIFMNICIFLGYKRLKHDCELKMLAQLLQNIRSRNPIGLRERACKKGII